MARQVLEDVLSLLYLSESNLTQQQKDFRKFVWQFHGFTESIEAAEFAESINPKWSNPDLPPVRAAREKARALLANNPMLNAITNPLRGRVRKGDVNQVVYDEE